MAGITLGEFGVSEKDFGIQHAKAMWDWMATQEPSDLTKELFGEGLYLNAVPLVNTQFDLLTPWQKTEYLHEIVLKALDYYGKNKTRSNFLNKFPSPPETEADAQKIWGHIRWKLKNECNEIGRIYNRRKLRHEQIEAAGARFGFGVMPLRRQDVYVGMRVSVAAIMDAMGHPEPEDHFQQPFKRTQELRS